MQDAPILAAYTEFCTTLQRSAVAHYNPLACCASSGGVGIINVITKAIIIKVHSDNGRRRRQGAGCFDGFSFLPLNETALEVAPLLHFVPLVTEVGASRP